nr:dual-specificity RNA methyltransferase RlmN [Tanacetum cinerariifolium]
MNMTSFRSVFDAAFIRTEFEKAGINPNFIPIIWKYVIQNADCEWRDIPSLPSSAYSLLIS